MLIDHGHPFFHEAIDRDGIPRVDDDHVTLLKFLKGRFHLLSVAEQANKLSLLPERLHQQPLGIVLGLLDQHPSEA